MTSFAPDQYKETLIFLATAGVVVPLFRRLRISPVLGFLVAGVLLGPFGVGSAAKKIAWLSPLALGDVDQIQPVAEFGVVFLLFMIGLELSWERLALMRRFVFGFGALQVFGSAAAIGGLALLFKETPISAAILGFSLAMSSTAVVIPVLAEAKRLGTASGRIVFAVLLFQDLMVAPLLFMVAMLGVRELNLGAAILSTFVPAIVGLSIVVVGGRLVLRPLFHHVASAGSTEFFVAACLLVVISAAVLSARFGLSMGLGAFIAGVLLAETEFRREIEVTIEPFKGLLLGLFFVSVGADLDLSEVLAEPIWTFGLALGFIIVKFAVAWLIGRMLRLSTPTSTETALMLSPGGEFAFIIIASALASKAMPSATAAHVTVAVTVSMFAVPALGFLGRRLGRPQAAAEPLEPLPPLEHDHPHDAILVGYGRVGRLVGEMLQAHDLRYLAIDTDAALVKRFRSQGVDIYWGNAMRADFLARCGLARAKALIITMDKPSDAERIVRLARSEYPHLTIVARARDAHHATLLYKLGVTDAVPETIEASLQLSEAVLVEMGIPMGLVIASIHEKRDEFRKILQPVALRAEERRVTKLSLRIKEAGRRKPRSTAED